MKITVVYRTPARDFIVPCLYSDLDDLVNCVVARLKAGYQVVRMFSKHGVCLGPVELRAHLTDEQFKRLNEVIHNPGPVQPLDPRVMSEKALTQIPSGKADRRRKAR